MQVSAPTLYVVINVVKKKQLNKMYSKSTRTIANLKKPIYIYAQSLPVVKNATFKRTASIFLGIIPKSFVLNG